MFCTLLAGTLAHALLFCATRQPDAPYRVGVAKEIV